MTGPVHVTHHDGRWHVAIDAHRYEDGHGYRLKRDAVIAARALARYIGAELVVRNRNGRIGWRNSFGGDSPRRPG